MRRHAIVVIACNNLTSLCGDGKQNPLKQVGAWKRRWNFAVVVVHIVKTGWHIGVVANQNAQTIPAGRIENSGSGTSS
jgi:hypothetical protein